MSKIKTPLCAVDRGCDYSPPCDISDRDGAFVASCYEGMADELVRIVNAHEALVEACRQARDRARPRCGLCQSELYIEPHRDTCPLVVALKLAGETA